MNAAQEFHLLTELRWLIGSALYDAERLERIAADWASADRSAHEMAAKQYVRLEQLQNRPRDREMFYEAMAAKQPLQAEFFAGVEAWLATISRISLIFYPARNGVNDIHFERGKSMRALFEVGEGHLLRDRELRNRWQHIDEALDVQRDGPVHPQRFIHSTEYAADVAARTLRLLIVDTLEIEHLGEARIAIRQVVDEVQALNARLPDIMNSWGERHQEELDIGHRDA